jgi:prepilin-type N-terminal cleavage/methylation domain-containing protein/prepilin-type processing-associated H-X9-DG protein
MKMPQSITRGFTMVELITVIAIIAVLMAMITPVASNMIASARRASDANNLRQLAMATIAYINEKGSTGSITFDSVDDWAVALAQAGNFNEPALFFAIGDSALPTTLPTKVHTSGTVDTTFAASALSVAAAATISLTNSAASTPIIWTRGLDSSTRTWASTAPYGTKGGYVAFLDGHVVFYNTVPSNITIPTSVLERD